MSARVGSSRVGVLAIVLVSYLMIVIDISIVITGLPKIQQGLEFSPTGLSWVHQRYWTASMGDRRDTSIQGLDIVNRTLGP